MIQLWLLKTLAKVWKDPSFANEYAVITSLMKLLGAKPGYVVDIGASDGVNQSSTLRFFTRGFPGLAIEFDPRKFRALSFVLADVPLVALARAKVTPCNVARLLDGFEVPKDFLLLNLDIDSYDLEVVAALLSSGFRPKIISLEINEMIPPGLYFNVLFDEAHSSNGDRFFGCSIDAAWETLVPLGYELVQVEYNNAFFVNAEYCNSGVQGIAPKEGWEKGFFERSNRRKLFWWNSDFEYWLHLTTLEAMGAIDDHFTPYRGKYELRISNTMK